MNEDNQPTEKELALFRFLWVAFLIVVVLVAQLVHSVMNPPKPTFYPIERWYFAPTSIDTLKIYDSIDKK